MRLQAHPAPLTPLDVTAGSLQAVGIRIRTAVATGTPALEVIRRIIQSGQDLVQEDAGQCCGRPGLPSLDSRSWRRCPCSVWIIKGHGTGRSTGFLAGIDTQAKETGRARLDRATAALAVSLARLDGSDLDIAGVWQSSGEWTLSPARFRLPPEEVELIVEAEEHRSADQPRESAREASKEPDGRGSRHLKGDAETAITRLAEELGADAILIGAVDREGTRRVATSDTTDRIVRGMNRPMPDIRPERFVPPIPAPTEAHMT